MAPDHEFLIQVFKRVGLLDLGLGPVLHVCTRKLKSRAQSKLGVHKMHQGLGFLGYRA